jgi:hypothetical protein
MTDRNQWGPHIVGALTTCGEIQPEKATPQVAARSIHSMHEDRVVKDRKIAELKEELLTLQGKLRDAHNRIGAMVG